MTPQETIDIIADFAHRWVTEVIWPYIGVAVASSTMKLEGEGFTRTEARFWLGALTILQLHRMGYSMGAVWHGYEVVEVERPYHWAYERGVPFKVYEDEEEEARRVPEHA